MSSILKVALAGATGNLGPSILNQLLKAGFQTTVLTRQGSKHTFPASVKVEHVDYDSLDSLTAALAGQDALVSTLAAEAFTKQNLLIDAAIKAGVKRYIPSEFGSNTLASKTSKLPAFADKVAIQKVLKAKAAEGSLSYTIISNGPFFDWGIAIGWLVNVKEKSITLWDGGDRRFSTTTLDTVGKAVAGVLKKPEETKNRAVYVNDTAITLKELLALAKQVAGPDGWKETVGSTDELLKQGYDELAKPQPDPAKFVMNFIQVSIWGEGYESLFEKTDNELLGIKEFTNEDILALLKSNL